MAAHPEVLADWDLTADEKAALLEEDRPSTFTMTVGNIPAGAAVEIEAWAYKPLG